MISDNEMRLLDDRPTSGIGWYSLQALPTVTQDDRPGHTSGMFRMNARYTYALHVLRALVTNLFPADYDYEAPRQTLLHRLYLRSSTTSSGLEGQAAYSVTFFRSS